ncbi:MAG: hypothetical protein QM791_02960 [Ferruginibacter sp.]
MEIQNLPVEIEFICEFSDNDEVQELAEQHRCDVQFKALKKQEFMSHKRPIGVHVVGEKHCVLAFVFMLGSCCSATFLNIPLSTFYKEYKG